MRLPISTVLLLITATMIARAATVAAQPIEGDYALFEDQTVAIRHDGARWTCAVADGPFHPMTAVNRSVYRVEALDATLSFIAGRRGGPDVLEMTRYGQAIPMPRTVESRPVVASPRRCVATRELLDDLIPRLMILHSVPGVSVAVVEDRAVAWRRQYGLRQAGTDEKIDENTLFEACSMSKPVFAYVVLQLVEQGRLDLDRPLVEYLDEPYLSDDPRHEKITARMVLCHSCGFPNWRKKGEPLRVKFEPGTRFEYSGEGFKYLQHVIERLTGTTLEKHARRALLDPVGMKSSSFVWEKPYEQLAAAGHDEQGVVKTAKPRFLEANSAASLFTTPSEYALFQIEMMRPDRSAEHSLSRETIEKMLVRAFKADGRKPVKRCSPATSDDVYFGLGWQIDATPLGDRIYHGGTNGSGFRCYNEFDPRRGSGLVLMTNGLSGNKLWEAVVERIAP
ncbi:MAG: beta-lactamase family protein [Pirellulaceae bacterium]|nr:beta-lactamase family protein [Pirellulaceae bacterium]